MSSLLPKCLASGLIQHQNQDLILLWPSLRTPRKHATRPPTADHHDTAHTTPSRPAMPPVISSTCLRPPRPSEAGAADSHHAPPPLPTPALGHMTDTVRAAPRQSHHRPLPTSAPRAPPPALDPTKPDRHPAGALDSPDT